MDDASGYKREQTIVRKITSKSKRKKRLRRRLHHTQRARLDRGSSCTFVNTRLYIASTKVQFQAGRSDSTVEFLVREAFEIGSSSSSNNNGNNNRLSFQGHPLTLDDANTSSFHERPLTSKQWTNLTYHNTTQRTELSLNGHDGPLCLYSAELPIFG